MMIKLTDPTYADVRTAVSRASDAADRGARTRTVGRLAATASAKVMAADAGHLEYNGGGASNAYGHRATTSALEVVWATFGGRKVVVIHGARVEASGRHVKRLTPGTRATKAAPAFLLHPSLFFVYGLRSTTKTARTTIEGLVAQIINDPSNAAPWHVLANYLEESAVADLPGVIREFVPPPVFTLS